MDANKELWRQLKTILILFTLAIILLQFYFLAMKLPLDMAYTNKTVGFFKIYLDKLTQSFTLWLPLIFFLVSQLIIQTTLSFLVFLVTKLVVTQYPNIAKAPLLIGGSLWVICQLCIYLWNWYLYPYSFFAIGLAKLAVPNVIFYALLGLTSTTIVIVLLLALIACVKQQPRLFFNSILFIVLLLGASYLIRTFSPQFYFQKNNRPNIIVIITDSLRPDYAAPGLKKEGPKGVQEFISRAAFFSNSLTLLGRSTPGLVAILTGNYPKTNGARFNLISNRHLKLHTSLTQLLKANGYHTIFMADGRQFINLDNTFGFDEVISAKSGIYDFIFTLINDTPLSNLLMNTFLGEILFPYNYANRNSYYTYLPTSFIHLVDRKLRNSQPQKPVLIVAALTIAHWPYVFARQPNFTHLSDRYENSVLQLDKQFQDLLQLFKKRGLLANSIIITLSDHGDSLGLPGDRIITPNQYRGDRKRLPLISQFPYTQSTTGKLIGMDTSAGHGTDLLSLTQLQTTLAFRYDGKIKPQTIAERVALIDVAPTLINLLKLKTAIKFEGTSLHPLLMGERNSQELDRPIYLESEIDIPLIDVTDNQSKVTSLSRLINRYASLYDIDLETQQLVLKDAVIANLLQEKQRGIIYKNWLLVKFPGKNRLQTRVASVDDPELKNCYYVSPVNKHKTDSPLFCYYLAPTVPYYVLVNLTTKEWQIYLSNEKTKDAMFNLLQQKLQFFYGAELSMHPHPAT